MKLNAKISKIQTHKFIIYLINKMKLNAKISKIQISKEIEQENHRNLNKQTKRHSRHIVWRGN